MARARASLARTTAAAPSVSGLALPAVIVPCSRSNTGRSVPRFSRGEARRVGVSGVVGRRAGGGARGFRGGGFGLRGGDRGGGGGGGQGGGGVGGRLPPAGDDDVGVTACNVVGGARDRDARGRARQPDGERGNASGHREREDHLACEVVVRDRPRDVPEDDLVDLTRIDLGAGERLRGGRACEVEDVELGKGGSRLHERRPGTPEYQRTRHRACKASGQASFDVMSMMQPVGQWEAAYDPGVPRHLTYPKLPLHALLESAARERPKAIATVFGGAVGGRCIDAGLTYQQLDDLASRVAAGLQRLGIRKGDRVALVLPNCPQFVYSFFGTLKAGAVVVPTNPLYTVRELHGQLADSGARVVVVLSRLYPQVAEAAIGTDVEKIVVTNVKQHFPLALRVLFTLARERKEGHRVDIRRDPRAMWLRDLVAPGSPPEAVDVSSSDLAVLQ